MWPEFAVCLRDLGWVRAVWSVVGPHPQTAFYLSASSSADHPASRSEFYVRPQPVGTGNLSAVSRLIPFAPESRARETVARKDGDLVSLPGAEVA